jgi:hypothetical protein
MYSFPGFSWPYPRMQWGLWWTTHNSLTIYTWAHLGLYVLMQRRPPKKTARNNLHMCHTSVLTVKILQHLRTAISWNDNSNIPSTDNSPPSFRFYYGLRDGFGHFIGQPFLVKCKTRLKTWSLRVAASTCEDVSGRLSIWLTLKHVIFSTSLYFPLMRSFRGNRDKASALACSWVH